MNQKYLGAADKLLQNSILACTPLQNRVLYSHMQEFGAVTLLYDIAARLEITDIIDRHLPKRKQGASAGQYILIEAINRAVAPTPTVNLEEWYGNTVLPTLTGIEKKAFTAQNFWNNTEIDSQTIQNIENDILNTVCCKYDIDTSHIIYNATNFFTYIDTISDCDSAKRGHSKEKRNDLRIVGLSLMVSPDFSIPLLHETYPGNQADSVEFRKMMEELRNRYETLTGKKTDITIVFDRGNNSTDNLSFLENEDFPFHYVGGLKRNQSDELFSVPGDLYIPLNQEQFPEHLAYRTKYKAFGRNVTALIVYNPALYKGQMQDISINMEKTSCKLLELQQKLLLRSKGEITKGKKPTKESVTTAVKKILKTEYMGELFTFLIVEQNGIPLLTYAKSEHALEILAERELGKTVLFTDRDDYSNEDIIKAYRSAWHVESSCRQMKDTGHLTVRPFFHWKDERIKVHIFTCVLAYRLCCLLRRELSQAGIKTSINQMIEETSKLKAVTTFFDDVAKPQKVCSYTVGSDITEKIASYYNLREKYNS